MGTIPHLKSGIHEEIKVLEQEKSFRLTIHRSDSSHMLYLGGAHVYCISFQIYLPDSIYVSFQSTSIALLDTFYYHNLCSLSHSFLRGIDTKQIFDIMISYILDNYPFINTIKLKDYSSRTCDNGVSINLYEKFYITTSKTWYQLKYNAYLDEKYETMFQARHKEFTEVKQVLLWKDMKRFIISDRLPENIQEYYETSFTWQDFFTKLEKQMGTSEFSIFIAPWISSFLSTLFKFDFRAPFYYIDIKNSKNSKNIKIVNYKQVGDYKSKKKYTRKNKMFAPLLLL